MIECKSCDTYCPTRFVKIFSPFTLDQIVCLNCIDSFSELKKVKTVKYQVFQESKLNQLGKKQLKELINQLELAENVTDEQVDFIKEIANETVMHRLKSYCEGVDKRKQTITTFFAPISLHQFLFEQEDNVKRYCEKMNTVSYLFYKGKLNVRFFQLLDNDLGTSRRYNLLSPELENELTVSNIVEGKQCLSFNQKDASGFFLLIGDTYYCCMLDQTKTIHKDVIEGLGRVWFLEQEQQNLNRKIQHETLENVQMKATCKCNGEKCMRDGLFKNHKNCKRIQFDARVCPDCKILQPFALQSHICPNKDNKVRECAWLHPCTYLCEHEKFSHLCRPTKQCKGKLRIIDKTFYPYFFKL